GVESAVVNLATERATVIAEPEVTPELLIAAVEAAGYEGRAVPSGRIANAATTSGVAGASMGPNALADSHAPESADGDAHHALGADTASDTGYQRRHLVDLRRRLLIAAALTVPLLLGLARMTVAPFLPAILSEPLLQLALATPVQFWAGWPFYRGAWKVLRHGSTDMNTLIAVGTSAAYLANLAAILFPDFFLAAGAGAAAASTTPPLYFDTAATIVTLILLGRYLEARARSQTSDAIRALVRLQPRTARIRRDGVERDAPVD